MDYKLLIISTFIVTALWDVVLRVMSLNYEKLPTYFQMDFVEYLIGVGVNANLTLINDGSYTPPFINNLDQTLYFYPVTMDDGVGQDHDINGDDCFDIGTVISVTFLNEINVVQPKIA